MDSISELEAKMQYIECPSSIFPQQVSIKKLKDKQAEEILKEKNPINMLIKAYCAAHKIVASKENLELFITMSQDPNLDCCEVITKRFMSIREIVALNSDQVQSILKEPTIYGQIIRLYLIVNKKTVSKEIFELLKTVIQKNNQDCYLKLTNHKININRIIELNDADALEVLSTKSTIGFNIKLYIALVGTHISQEIIDAITNYIDEKGYTNIPICMSLLKSEAFLRGSDALAILRLFLSGEYNQTKLEVARDVARDKYVSPCLLRADIIKTILDSKDTNTFQAAVTAKSIYVLTSPIVLQIIQKVAFAGRNVEYLGAIARSEKGSTAEHILQLMDFVMETEDKDKAAVYTSIIINSKLFRGFCDWTVIPESKAETIVGSHKREDRMNYSVLLKDLANMNFVQYTKKEVPVLLDSSETTPKKYDFNTLNVLTETDKADKGDKVFICHNNEEDIPYTRIRKQ